MMNGMLAVASGIGNMASNNVEAQLNSGLYLIFLVGVALPLNQQWSKWLEKDQYTYFADSLKVSVSHPEYAALVAADYQRYQMDSQSMTQETDYQNTLVQNQKTLVRSLGNATTEVYNMQLPLNEAQKMTIRLMLGF